MIIKFKTIVNTIHKLFPYFHSLYLWLFYRNEWVFVSENYIGKRGIPETKIRLKLFEKSYKHNVYGYIRKTQYLI